VAHLDDLRDDRLLSPSDAEDLRKLAKVDRRRLTDREDRVSEPPHAEVGKLVVKELDTKLLGE
jgi:hypothetical protein